MTAALLLVAGLVLGLPQPSVVSLRLLGPRLLGPSIERSVAGRAADVNRGRAFRPRLSSAQISAATGSSIAVIALCSGLPAPAAVSSGLVAAVAASTGAAALERRRDVIAQRRIAAAVEVLHAELSAGSREPAALRAAAAAAGGTAVHGTAGAAATAMMQAAALAELGLDPAPALAAAGPLRALDAAWRVRTACGAPLADVIEQVGRDVAAGQSRRRAADTALAGPRASSGMLALLPLVGFGLGTAMGAHPLRFLLSPGPGPLVLLAGVGLDVVGWCWIALLVRRARR